jgi:competence protein ComEC
VKQSRRFRRTTIISVGLLAFLTGLVLAKTHGLKVESLAVLSVLPFLFISRKRTAGTLAAAVVLALLAGVWRGGSMQVELARYGQFYDQDVTVKGRVLDDPVYDDQGRLDFRIGSITVDEQSMPGQVRIKARVNGVRRGDSVRAHGTMRDGFGNYQAALYYANIDVVSRTDSPLEKLRREFFASVYSVLPEPQGSLGLGFLVGLRSALPEDFDDQLRVAGLTHIVVASGYNLTVLVRLCRRLLAKYSKYQAFVGALILILGFIAVTGASPSIIRASIVTVLSLIAWYYGRRFQPVLIILLGAALTAGFNPLFIWSDLGWWLSFLAFAGVLILAPLITAKFWQHKQPPLLAQVAIETTAAQLLATPLILFTFGEISLVALLANVAVVPFIPFAMAGTFIAGVANAVLPAWSGLLAVPANLVLSYIVSVTRLFASPSWAQQNLKIGAVGMATCYIGVGLLVIVLYRKLKFRFNDIPSVVE